MDQDDNKIIEVTCAIIARDSMVLGALRSRQMADSWKWEFPGGKIDKGETAEECVKREIKEELNVNIIIEQALKPILQIYEDKTIRLIPFICSIKSGEIKAVEHEKVSWFKPEELQSLNWAAADAEILNNFLVEYFAEK